MAKGPGAIAGFVRCGKCGWVRPQGGVLTKVNSGDLHAANLHTKSLSKLGAAGRKSDRVDSLNDK